MRTTTHEEVVLHLRDIRKMLSRMGWNLQAMAEAIGVRKQTFSQYCMLPGTAGARLIPADKLDKLRATYTEEKMAAMDEGFPAFLNADEHLWVARQADGQTLFTSTSPWRAQWASARAGGHAIPGPLNEKPTRVSSNQALCLGWVRAISAGRITREEACEIAGVDEYLVGRVGHELAAWRIQPTEEQVQRAIDLDLARLLGGRDAA